MELKDIKVTKNTFGFIQIPKKKKQKFKFAAVIAYYFANPDLKPKNEYFDIYKKLSHLLNYSDIESESVIFLYGIYKKIFKNIKKTETELDEIQNELLLAGYTIMDSILCDDCAPLTHLNQYTKKLKDFDSYFSFVFEIANTFKWNCKITPDEFNTLFQEILEIEKIVRKTKEKFEKVPDFIQK